MQEKTEFNGTEAVLSLMLRGMSWADFEVIFPGKLNEKAVNSLICQLGNQIIEFLSIEFDKNCEIINSWQKDNGKLIFSVDGRWSSRRNGKECTVGFIICNGPKELQKQVIFHGNVLSKRKNIEIMENIFLIDSEFSYSSNSMESYCVEKSFQIFRKKEILPDGIVSDGDSSLFIRAKEVCEESEHQLLKFLDRNHIKKNLKTTIIPKWIQQSMCLEIILRYFRLKTKFPKKTVWLSDLSNADFRN